MPEKKMLIVDQKLMRKIDENSGNLSRAEFVNLCIDACLKEEGKPQEPEKENRENYITKQEFKDFKEEVRNHFQNFFEILCYLWNGCAKEGI